MSISSTIRRRRSEADGKAHQATMPAKLASVIADALKSRPKTSLLLCGLFAHAALWLSALWFGPPSPAALLRFDAPSYLALARMILTGERSPFEWDERVFLGWPTLIAAAGGVFSLQATCLVVGALLASIVPPLYHQLTGRFRESLLLTCFTPTWLLHSSFGMSESAYLFFLSASLLAFCRGRFVGSGLLIAAASLVRPTAVCLCVGMAFVLLRRRAWLQLAGWSALCLTGPLVQISLNQYFYGDWNRQSDLHAAPQNLPAGLSADQSRTQFSVPFKSLLLTPRRFPTPLWKIVFIYTHLACVLSASLVALSRWRADDLSTVMAGWIWTNTMFICSTGPYWGFHSFDRYCVWALPGYLYFLGPLLSRSRVLSIGVMFASICAAVWAASPR